MKAYEEETADVFDGETCQTVQKTVLHRLEARYAGEGIARRPLVKCVICGYLFAKSDVTFVNGKPYCRANKCVQDVQ